MLPAVQFLSERGWLTAVRAVVKGNRLRSEVTVHAERAAELLQDWMNAVPAAAQPATPPTVMSERATTVCNAQESTHSSPAGPPAPDQVPAAAPPAWYANPNGAARLRWWEGTAWTEHTAP